MKNQRKHRFAKNMKTNQFLPIREIFAIMALIGLFGQTLQAQTWTGTLNGTAENWNVGSNWSGGAFPNAIGANASINADITAAKSISLQQAITVGSLTIGDSNATSPSALTIASGTGTNILTFDNTSGNASLLNVGGANVISAGVNLTDSLDLTTTTALTLSGAVSGAGTLNKLAAGTAALTLSGNNTGWSGGIINRQGTINMTGAAGNATLGTGTFTFANVDGGAGNTLTLNAAVSKTIANNFVQNNADVQTGSEYAQISISGGSSGYRVLTFTGNFSTGANFFGGTAGNANGQSLFLNAQTGTGTAANESTFIFTGDWSGYNGTAGGLATANTSAFRLQSGSYVFDKSAASASASSGFQLQSTDPTVSGKLILSEDTSLLANAVQFNNATGQRHSLGSSAGANSTVTSSGAISITAAPGANFFAQNASGKLVVSGLVSGSGAGGLEINKSYTYTSADTVNSLQTPTGTVELSRAAGNTYSGGTTVTAGTLLVSNTSGSGTGTGAVSVVTGATFGGTGKILPAGAFGISVANGGFIAPGTTGIGNLTIDLTSTSGTVSMLSGSAFKFQLGTANPIQLGGNIGTIAAGSSDLLTLVGASAGDFAFNGNNIDFLGTGTGTGYYKLFDTSSNNASTWTGLTFDSATGLVSAGLTASNFTGGETANFYVGTSSNGGNLGDIYLNVIPEPSTHAMLAGGLGLLAFMRLIRRRSDRA